MYRTSFMLALMISTATLAKLEPGKCAGGEGNLLTTNDNIQYCQSQIDMNWWSAFAWCKSIGEDLIDMTTECNIGRTPETTVPCPHLTGIGGSGWSWSANVPDASEAYGVNLSDGAVKTNYRHGPWGRYFNAARALCRLSSSPTP